MYACSILFFLCNSLKIFRRLSLGNAHEKVVCKEQRRCGPFLVRIPNAGRRTVLLRTERARDCATGLLTRDSRRFMNTPLYCSIGPLLTKRIIIARGCRINITLFQSPDREIDSLHASQCCLFGGGILLSRPLAGNCFCRPTSLFIAFFSVWSPSYDKHQGRSF